MSGSQKARSADPIDEHVGRQIERRRKARAASQSSLAEAVGVRGFVNPKDAMRAIEQARVLILTTEPDDR